MSSELLADNSIGVDAASASDFSGDDRPGEPTLAITRIAKRPGWRTLDLAELWGRRDVLYMLAWRDISVRYKQTAFGVLWAVLRPLLLMLIFTVFVGRLAGADSGEIPYPLFVYAGMLVWTLFSSTLTAASESVVGAERLITKVYFPRILMPAAAAAPPIIDFAIGSTMLVGLMVSYGVAPSAMIPLAPVAVLMTLAPALAVGVALAALNVVYRDVRFAIPFLVQAGLFATPAIYLDVNQLVAASEPGSITRWLIAANPINASVEAFRVCLLGGEIDLTRLAVGVGLALIVLLASLLLFRRYEDSFADLI